MLKLVRPSLFGNQPPSKETKPKSEPRDDTMRQPRDGDDMFADIGFEEVDLDNQMLLLAIQESLKH